MKKKGFTLAELLAVIVILGLIAIITIPAVTKTLGNTKANLCEDQLKNIKEAARLYGSDHLLDLPSAEGDTTNITLGVLQDEGYIATDLENPKNKEPISRDLKITIKKQGKKYVYDVQNFCDSTNDDGNIATIPEAQKYKSYKTGKTGEVSVIYFNPVENRGCTVEEYNTDTNNETLTVVAKQTNGCMKWYAIENSGEDKSTVDVLLNHYLLETQLVGGNSNGTYYSFDDISIVENALKSLTDIYNWKVTPRLISADEIAKITNNQSFKSNVSTYKEAEAEQFYFDTNTKNPNGTYGSQYSWLYDYSPFCKGCNLENKEYSDDYGEIWGYWTSSFAYVDDSLNYKNYWVVYRDGKLIALDTGNSDPGLRPVITINKDVLN